MPFKEKERRRTSGVRLIMTAPEFSSESSQSMHEPQAHGSILENFPFSWSLLMRYTKYSVIGSDLPLTGVGLAPDPAQTVTKGYMSLLTFESTVDVFAHCATRRSRNRLAD